MSFFLKTSILFQFWLAFLRVLCIRSIVLAIYSLQQITVCFKSINHKSDKQLYAMLTSYTRRYTSKRAPWEILGVQRTANAEEVKKAFLEQSKLTHPDTSETGSTERFADVQEAYNNYKRSGGWVPVLKRTHSYQQSYEKYMDDLPDDFHRQAAKHRERAQRPPADPHDARPPQVPDQAKIFIAGLVALLGAFKVWHWMKPPVTVRFFVLNTVLLHDSTPKLWISI